MIWIGIPIGVGETDAIYTPSNYRSQRGHSHNESVVRDEKRARIEADGSAQVRRSKGAELLKDGLGIPRGVDKAAIRKQVQFGV